MTGCFTLPHTGADSLAALLRVLSEGFSAVFSGEAAQDDKAEFGIVGQIRSPDFTHSTANGWHPHIHFIILTRRPLTDTQRERLQARLFVRWKSYLRRKLDRNAVPIANRLEQLRSGKDLAKYLVKAGLEITRHDAKEAAGKGRNPWQILRDLSQRGDARDLALWGEWERATLGCQAVTWSRGLKRVLAVDEVEDLELAQDSADGAESLVPLGKTGLSVLVSVRGAWSAVLRAAEVGGRNAAILALCQAAEWWAAPRGVPVPESQDLFGLPAWAL